MNTKELSVAVAELQQQVADLRALIDAQASEIVALRTRQMPGTQRSASEAFQFAKAARLEAVARLSAKFPHAHSFTPAQVAAEIAEHEEHA